MTNTKLAQLCTPPVSTHSGHSRFYSSSIDGSSLVHVSRQRLEALLEAEIVHLARENAHPISLKRILAHRDPDTLRAFLLVELPIRYAKRILLIESLKGWRDFPHMRRIRSIYSDAFRRLRSLSPNSAEDFRNTLDTMESKHSDILREVIKGTRAMKNAGAIEDGHVDKFLGDFLTARIGTNILRSQYRAITLPEGPEGSMISVIDPHCDPAKLTRFAAADAVRICKRNYGANPAVLVANVNQVKFPCIPQYLNYIMFEILKNALRAVTERFNADPEELAKHPIKVTVCGDDSTVVIRVSDAGGGIELDELPRIWSYLYTTARPAFEDSTTEFSDETDDESDEAIMAGFGCGLPLSRTYAQYCGGYLELNSLPKHGTDAYLYLDRNGTTEEIVDHQALPLRWNLAARPSS